MSPRGPAPGPDARDDDEEDEGTLHTGVAIAGRLDVAVAALVPDLSRSRATALVKEGAVTVAGQPARKPSDKVDEGTPLSVLVPAPTPLEALPQDLPITIVYEDADVVVVDKAAGMVVHPGAGHPDGTLVNALLFHVRDLSGIGGVARPGIVHRLDRGTSGLLVVAKHDTAHRALQAQFADHSAGRRYLAVTMGVPRAPSGTIQSRLARHPKDRIRFASTEGSHGKEAITHWRRRSAARGCALVECVLQTGRTHQVRVHLAEAGWPLLGDGTYAGKRRPNSLVRDLVGDRDRPMLHAWQLRFAHPADGRPCQFVVPPPPDLQAVLDRLALPVPDPQDILPRPT